MPVLKKQNCSQNFLDEGQYSRNGILRYEKIFGHTFVSTGGFSTTDEFCGNLPLKPGMKVLDIGCGTGGSAFYLARKYGVEVLGIDLSQNMLDIANEHKAEMEESVQNLVKFRFLDATKAVFPSDHFDMMYSRDAIMHIADKDKLYTNVFKWLKPKGFVLVSEYINGPNNPNHPEDYIKYLINRGYQLETLQGYADVLTRSGFENVEKVDLSKKFISILNQEMKTFQGMKADFEKEFSANDYTDLMEGWKIKIVRINAGDQAWGLFKAVKPVETL